MVGPALRDSDIHCLAVLWAFSERVLRADGDWVPAGTRDATYLSAEVVLPEFNLRTKPLTTSRPTPSNPSEAGSGAGDDGVARSTAAGLAIREGLVVTDAVARGTSPRNATNTLSLAGNGNDGNLAAVNLRLRSASSF